MGRSDLGKHTLEVRSPGRGSGTGRGLRLNRGLWIWREGVHWFREGAALELTVSKKAGPVCLWIPYLSTWVDSEATNGARKSRFGAHKEDGLACKSF